VGGLQFTTSPSRKSVRPYVNKKLGKVFHGCNAGCAEGKGRSVRVQDWVGQNTDPTGKIAKAKKRPRHGSSGRMLA
jgi:hypothetical protein